MTVTLGISAQDALAGVKDGTVQLLDVRDPSEILAKGTAAGALCIPLADLEMRGDPSNPCFDHALTARPTLAVFCTMGSRSVMATQMLRNYGLEDVRDLGSLRNWQDAGGPVVC